MKVVLLLSALLACAVAEDVFHSIKIGKDFSDDEILNFHHNNDNDNDGDDGDDGDDDDDHSHEIELIRGTYETPLNHINAVDPRRLRLVYAANVEFYEEGGPLFFYFGDNSEHWLQAGLVFDLARELNGALISAHQRCFGRNHWSNSTVATLEFCTLEHALSDVPHLVNTVKQNMDAPDARVVLWGARIGGTIAALARKKFPHIVDGAWSSSGFFNAVSLETQFYNAMAWNLYFRGQQNCSVKTGAAFHGIKELVDSANSSALQSLFRLCNPIDFNNAQEVSFFYETIFEYIHRYVHQRHINGLREYCSDIRYRNDPVRAFGRWVRHVFVDDDECLNLSYQNHINSLSNTNQASSGRSIFYFFCTQVAFIQRITPDEPLANVFPNVLSQEYHDNRCNDIFGNVFNRTLLQRAVLNFNLANGARNQVISNAIFSNGNLDPYIHHGIIEYDIFNSEAVVTQYTSGTADLDSINDLDTVELLETKRTIVAALTRFAVPDSNVDPEDPDEPEEPEDGDSDEVPNPINFRFNLS